MKYGRRRSKEFLLHKCKMKCQGYLYTAKDYVQQKNSKKVSKYVTSILEATLRFEANSTSCIVAFQPKAPKSLEKFRKLK